MERWELAKMTKKSLNVYLLVSRWFFHTQVNDSWDSQGDTAKRGASTVMWNTFVEGILHLLIDNIDDNNSVDNPNVRLGRVSFYLEILAEVL